MPRRRLRGRLPRDASARIAELAIAIDAQRAKTARRLFGTTLDGESLALAMLLSASAPTLAPSRKSDFEALASFAESGWTSARSRDDLKPLLAGRIATEGDPFPSTLRRFARAERMRIALRELLPVALGGADADVTAPELAALADVTIDAALDEAREWASARYGPPITEQGPSTFVVLGMGKLGGDELNPGSDVDLIYFYDTDEGEARRSATETTSLHEYWSRVGRRLTSTLEDVTEDGFVWRVDLRLRPEGGGGPLVNSVAAAERYYEAFGRSWERAAMLRARPVAGDLALGESLLGALATFVWQRRIDPSIASDMFGLVARGRVELAKNDARDLKLGEGGIREAEFFVQTLQLIWGGRDPSLRARGTLVALARLEAKGFVTTREAAEIGDAYLALRRVEHAVQTMSGIQTHTLPRSPDELGRLARALGHANAGELEARLDHHRSIVAERFRSLLPEDQALPNDRLGEVLAAIDSREVARLTKALHSVAPPTSDGETIERLAASLAALAQRADDLLGTRTRDAFPGLAEVLIESILDAADAVQAARYVRIFFARLRHPAVYVRLVARDPPALRRLVAIVGASAFVGDALLNNPDIGDRILFSREVVTTVAAVDEVRAAALVAPKPDEDPDEAMIGALRHAKTRATIEVALGLLAGELSIREVSATLAAVAIASLEVAIRRATGDDAMAVRGFAILALGKLGGDELSFGSDLDVLFLYEPGAAPAESDALAHFTRKARKVITFISAFHGAGPGYELDTRLRPSGNQGLLVTSLDAFARYHGFETAASDAARIPAQAAVWERMAVTRARAVAGDIEIGERAIAIAQRGVESAPPIDAGAVEEIRRIRQRVEREASLERRGTRDLKLGRGGLLDIEFVVQLLTLRAARDLGHERAPFGQDTSLALVTLEALDLLSAEHGETLANAYRFLRRLEAMIRVVRADASHVLEERSPTIRALGRRMGIRVADDAGEAEALVAKYIETTEDVRRVYEEVLGGGAPPH